MEKLENNRAETFEGQLNELKFDGEALKKQMYFILVDAKSSAFTLMKGEIQGKRGESYMPTMPEFENYIEKHGGSKFLQSIFERGLTGLKNDFNRQKYKLQKNLNSIKRRESFAKSKMAEKLARVADEVGVNLMDLSFEDAYNHGLYLDALSPTISGVAEYGLSWWEYKNRGARMAKLERESESKKSTTELIKKVPRVLQAQESEIGKSKLPATEVARRSDAEAEKKAESKKIETASPAKNPKTLQAPETEVGKPKMPAAEVTRRDAAEPEKSEALELEKTPVSVPKTPEIPKILQSQEGEVGRGKLPAAEVARRGGMEEAEKVPGTARIETVARRESAEPEKFRALEPEKAPVSVPKTPEIPKILQGQEGEVGRGKLPAAEVGRRDAAEPEKLGALQPEKTPEFKKVEPAPKEHPDKLMKEARGDLNALRETLNGDFKEEPYNSFDFYAAADLENPNIITIDDNNKPVVAISILRDKNNMPYFNLNGVAYHDSHKLYDAVKQKIDDYVEKAKEAAKTPEQKKEEQNEKLWVGNVNRLLKELRNRNISTVEQIDANHFNIKIRGQEYKIEALYQEKKLKVSYVRGDGNIVSTGIDLEFPLNSEKKQELVNKLLEFDSGRK